MHVPSRSAHLAVVPPQVADVLGGVRVVEPHADAVGGGKEVAAVGKGDVPLVGGGCVNGRKLVACLLVG